MLRKRRSSASQNFDVLYERYDPHHTIFVAKLSVVAIYALFEWLSQSVERKQSCFRRAFNENHPSFLELSTKAILLS